MDNEKVTIEFHLNNRSGVAPYLQIVQQVRRALKLGFLDMGDQLPTVRQVVAKLAINPNTVFKAYRELESAGLVESRPGLGTFIIRTLADESLASHDLLRTELSAWIRKAQAAGLDEESILALFYSALQTIEAK